MNNNYLLIKACKVIRLTISAHFYLFSYLHNAKVMYIRLENNKQNNLICQCTQ